MMGRARTSTELWLVTLVELWRSTQVPDSCGLCCPYCPRADYFHCYDGSGRVYRSARLNVAPVARDASDSFVRIVEKIGDMKTG